MEESDIISTHLEFYCDQVYKNHILYNALVSVFRAGNWELLILNTASESCKAAGFYYSNLTYKRKPLV